MPKDNSSIERTKAAAKLIRLEELRAKSGAPGAASAPAPETKLAEPTIETPAPGIEAPAKKIDEYVECPICHATVRNREICEICSSRLDAEPIPLAPLPPPEPIPKVPERQIKCTSCGNVETTTSTTCSTCSALFPDIQKEKPATVKLETVPIAESTAPAEVPAAAAGAETTATRSEQIEEKRRGELEALVAKEIEGLKTAFANPKLKQEAREKIEEDLEFISSSPAKYFRRKIKEFKNKGAAEVREYFQGMLDKVEAINAKYNAQLAELEQSRVKDIPVPAPEASEAVAEPEDIMIEPAVPNEDIERSKREATARETIEKATARLAEIERMLAEMADEEEVSTGTPPPTGEGKEK